MPKKKAKKKPTPGEETFEQSLGELERVVAELEGGELGLAEALDKYEEGVGRLKRCHAELERAEQKIELLSGVDAHGNPITEPFGEEGASSEDGTAAGRSRRRSRPSRGVDDGGQLF